MTTTREVTTQPAIKALRVEAGEHGDLAMVAVCDAALDGDSDAIAECVRVIADAAAMDDADADA